ncbi:MAG TPA: hypothetical protein VM658_01435 [bacterium]|nr:hypothetical protein [bacterium]
MARIKSVNGPDSAGGIMVRVLMNSGLEEVLSWKCCNLQGMNLEVHVINGSDERIEARSEMELTGPGGGERVAWLYPPGVHAILPGEALSFYCSHDEERFKTFTNVIIEDGRGRRFRARITGRAEPARIMD